MIQPLPQRPSTLRPTKLATGAVCSFCGNNTHGYTACPVLQQFIRQQADELSAARAREYLLPPMCLYRLKGGPVRKAPQPRDDTRTPGGILGREEKPPTRGQVDKPRGRGRYPPEDGQEQFGLPSGGGSGPPPGGGGGGPPDDEDGDEGDDEGEPEEEGEDEEDEDTISITDSSAPGGPGEGEGEGGPPRRRRSTWGS